MMPIGVRATTRTPLELADLRSRAQESLKAVHSAGLLHGNPSLESMCLKDGTVYFTGLANSKPRDDPERFQEEMADMLDQFQEMEVCNSKTHPPLPHPPADLNLIQSHPRVDGHKQMYSQCTL